MKLAKEDVLAVPDIFYYITTQVIINQSSKRYNLE